ncbi:copper resistance CopC family protein, partial [Cellulomonas massiliensis]|uniref:copper resistance CopC family protein n=1 Tax=Cellulomonas massiliensis TaxID=1465811 RepID=UPI000368F980
MPLSSLRPPRALRAALLTVALVPAALAALALPAQAHDTLLDSDPADGTVVATAPEQVTLTFNEAVLELGTSVAVTGPDGERVDEGEASVTDAVVTQALRADRPAGEYTVLWRATSSDGHPITGELAFRATDAVGTEEPSAPASGTPGAALTPTAEASASVQPQTAAPSASPTPAAGPLAGSGIPTWLAVVLGVAAFGAAGTALVVLRRRS